MQSRTNIVRSQFRLTRMLLKRDVCLYFILKSVYVKKAPRNDINFVIFLYEAVYPTYHDFTFFQNDQI